jgi:hypothetical protein
VNDYLRHTADFFESPQSKDAITRGAAQRQPVAPSTSAREEAAPVIQPCQPGCAATARGLSPDSIYASIAAYPIEVTLWPGKTEYCA